MINALSRLLCLAVCSLVVALAGVQSTAQTLDVNIVAAKVVDAEMKQQIAEYVDDVMRDLLDADSPKKVSAARRKLVDPIDDPNATTAFKAALSDMILDRGFDKAVTHDSELVRLNAMIVLSKMTDDKSRALIDAGMVDDSAAVKRWALHALSNRMMMWVVQGDAKLTTKSTAAVKQITTMLNAKQQADPIVVTAGFQALLQFAAPDVAQATPDRLKLISANPGVVNITREALIALLNARVAVHAADPNLSFAAEQIAMTRLGNAMALSPTFDRPTSRGLQQAAYRYCSLILSQVKNGLIGDEAMEDALVMLNQSFVAIGQTAAGAKIKSPPSQFQVRVWIENGQWDNLSNLLINEWKPILAAPPFDLTDQELAVEE